MPISAFKGTFKGTFARVFLANQTVENGLKMHDITITHPDRVFYDVLDITRVPWGAQKLFSQLGLFWDNRVPFGTPLGA